MNPSEKKLTGYRTHFARLKNIRSDVSAIRTHKFKCAIPKSGEQELWGKFQEVSKVVDSSSEGSLLWFLIQLYGLGFLFVPSAIQKDELLFALDPENPPLSIQKILEKIPQKFREKIINPTAFLTFLQTTPREAIPKIKETGFLPTGVLQNLGNIFLSEKLTAKNLAEFPETAEIHNALRDFALEKNDLKAEIIQEFFQEYWKTEVLFEKESEEKNGKTEKITFVISPLSSDVLEKNIKNSVDIYTAYFGHLLPISSKTGRGVQSLMGVDNNQNGISNLLGVSLKEFQKGKTATKELLSAGNPQFFSKNPEYLEILGNAVFELAQKISSAEKTDFFRKNWGDYRGLVGGRLAGWISNFENRLAVYKKYFCEFSEETDKEENTLKNKDYHLEILKHIQANTRIDGLFLVSIQNAIFEMEKLAEKFEKMFAEKRFSADFGTDLFLYRSHWQMLSEILMKWSNEGVPEELLNAIIYKEKLCSTKDTRKKKKGEENKISEKTTFFWDTKWIPKELELYPRFIGEAGKNPEKQLQNAAENIAKYAFEGNILVQAITKTAQKNETVDGWNQGKCFYNAVLEKLKDLALRSSPSFQKEIFLFLEKKCIDFFAIENHEKKEDLRTWWKEKNQKMLKFLVTPYHRFSYTQIPVFERSFPDFFEQFEEFFHLKNLNSEDHFFAFFKDKNGKIIPEKGELLKIYWGLCMRNISGEIFLPEEKFEVLPETSLGNMLFENGSWKQKTVSLSVFQRFIQASVGSEIRAKLGLLSRESFVERNVIQTTNGEQSFLQYIPYEWNDFSRFLVQEKKGKRKKFTKRKLKKMQFEAKTKFSENSVLVLTSVGIDFENQKNEEIVAEIWKIMKQQKFSVQQKLAQVLGEIPHSWAVVLKTKTIFEDIAPLTNGFFIEKSKANEFAFSTEKRGDFLYSFPIETSATQKQFLEKFLWGEKDGSITETILGGSIIVEQEKEVVWKENTVSVQNEKNGFSMFWAVPFQFENTKKAKPLENRFLGNTTLELTNSEGKKQKQYRTEKNLLGIDLGEYGFGYAVFDPETKKFIKFGFIEIPQLKKMRDDAADWKDTQSSGIFSRPTTHLAKIREHAAGAVRNSIHALALKYDAIPVYEDSVDGFETGGQRISKLYKTIKTSDIIGGSSNEADAGVRKHFWGDKFANIGVVIGAAKTSQTCRKCGRCATSEIEEYAKNAEEKEELQAGLFAEEKKSVAWKNGKEIFFEIFDKKIVGTDIACNLPNGEQTKSDVWNTVKKAQRKESEGEKILRETGKKNRGTIEEFHCQICQNITDCDAQAAQNIALKYFFKITATKEEQEKFTDEKTGKFSTLKYFLEKSKDFI